MLLNERQYGCCRGEEYSTNYLRHLALVFVSLGWEGMSLRWENFFFAFGFGRNYLKMLFYHDMVFWNSCTVFPPTYDRFSWVLAEEPCIVYSLFGEKIERVCQQMPKALSEKRTVWSGNPQHWTTTSNAPYNLKINITRETQRFLN